MSDQNDNAVSLNLSGRKSEESLSERVRSLRLPDRPSRSLSLIAVVPWALCLILGGSTAVLALKPAAAKTEEEPNFLPTVGNQKGVITPVVASTPANGVNASAGDTIALESKGYLMPVQLILVSPKVGGEILKLNIEEGSRIKKNDVVAVIESVEYQSDYDHCVAVFESAKHRWQQLWKYRTDEERQAQAELDDARAQLDPLRRDWVRNLDLRKSNALAAKEFEQSESSFRSMEHRVEKLKLTYDLLKSGPRDELIGSAKADMDQFEADVAKAKWKLENCTVRAPISGIVLSKKAEEGNQVNPSAFSNGLSASLCEMADLTNMEVDLAIAERDIAKVFKDQKCIVHAEAFSNRNYKGVVSRVMPTADRSQGAVHVRVKIDIPSEEEGVFLRPDMGAIVTFYGGKQ